MDFVYHSTLGLIVASYEKTSVAVPTKSNTDTVTFAIVSGFRV